MLVLEQADNGRTVDVHPGDKVRVSLAENATNGYRWELESCDETFIKPLTLEPLYTAEALGSGGAVAFTFEAKKSGWVRLF
jgi:predicted secreted protein